MSSAGECQTSRSLTRRYYIRWKSQKRSLQVAYEDEMTVSPSGTWFAVGGSGFVNTRWSGDRRWIWEDEAAHWMLQRCRLWKITGEYKPVSNLCRVLKKIKDDGYTNSKSTFTRWDERNNTLYKMADLMRKVDQVSTRIASILPTNWRVTVTNSNLSSQGRWL